MTTTETAPITRAAFGRKSAAALLFGLGLLALHVADAKTGPDEFFSSWTSWRTSEASPLLTLAGAAGFMLAFFAPIAVMAAVSPPEDRTGPAAVLGRFGAALLMPLGWALMMTLQSSPPWFSAFAACVALPVGAVLWFGLPRRTATSP